MSAFSGETLDIDGKREEKQTKQTKQAREHRASSQLSEDTLSAPCPHDPIVLTKECKAKGCVVHYLTTVPPQSHDPELLLYSNPSCTTAAGRRSDWYSPQLLEEKNGGLSMTDLVQTTDGPKFRDIFHPPPLPGVLFCVNPERKPISINMEYADKTVLSKVVSVGQDMSSVFKEVFRADNDYEHTQTFNLLDWMEEGPEELREATADSKRKEEIPSHRKGYIAPDTGYLNSRKRKPAAYVTKYIIPHRIDAVFYSSDTVVHFELATAAPSSTEKGFIEWANYVGKTTSYDDKDGGNGTKLRQMYPVVDKHSADRFSMCSTCAEHENVLPSNVTNIFRHDPRIWHHGELSWWLSIDPRKFANQINDAKVADEVQTIPVSMLKGNGSLEIAVSWYVVSNEMKTQLLPVWFWIVRRNDVLKDYCAELKLNQVDFVEKFSQVVVKETTKAVLMPIPTNLLQFMVGRVYSEFDFSKLLMPVDNLPNFCVVTKLHKGPEDYTKVRGLVRHPNIEFDLKIDYQYFDSDWTPTSTGVEEALNTFKTWGKTTHRTLADVANLNHQESNQR